jgi:pyruvate dehydrogenase E1 component alpha subunit/2-oxoisovalerate dehydrogenase E1 component alpha subunit
LLRLVGHGEHDDAAYVTPELKSSPLGRDCLKVGEEFLMQKGWASGEQITRWRAEAKNEVDVTAAKVQREPSPDPNEDDWKAISTPCETVAEA